MCFRVTSLWQTYQLITQTKCMHDLSIYNTTQPMVITDTSILCSTAVMLRSTYQHLSLQRSMVCSNWYDDGGPIFRRRVEGNSISIFVSLTISVQTSIYLLPMRLFSMTGWLIPVLWKPSIWPADSLLTGDLTESHARVRLPVLHLTLFPRWPVQARGRRVPLG